MALARGERSPGSSYPIRILRIGKPYLVWIGGWMGQYALAIAALLLYWSVKPRSFLGRSVLVVLIVQNLISEPPYIASLQGDSAGTLKVLEATGISGWQSVAIRKPSRCF